MDNSELAKSGKKRTIMIGIAAIAATAALVYYGCAFRDTARWKGNSIHVFSDGASIKCETAGDIVVPREIDGVPVTRVSLSGNAITSVSLPDSVTSLNVHCKSLCSVEFPENLFEIGRGAFADCTSLKSIYIPNVFYIGDGAFSGCSSLTDIYIPNGVDYLAYRTFQNCPSLQTISVPGSIQIEYANEWGFAPKWLPHISRRWSN